jgi:hypothetical protein
MPNQIIFEIQAHLCRTMSHALRLGIVHLLRDGPMRLMDIAASTGCSSVTGKTGSDTLHRETHGMRFISAIGPFKSKVAASWYHRYGQEDPRMEQAIVEETISTDELQAAYAFEWYERGVDELVFKHQAPMSPEEVDEALTGSNM